MAKRPPFILSEGVDLDLTDNTISLKYDGDVVIESTLGRDILSIEATGDLTVRLPRITGTLKAGKVLRVDGDVKAESLEGDSVILGDKSVTCRAISANRRIEIGAAALQVDAILAPHITIDPNASGRVTVIQSSNERAATKIKGGFSLADYEDMFGDSAEFLRSRGLAAPQGTIVPPADEEVVELTPNPSIAPPAIDDEEVDDPLSLSLDDLEPIQESDTADDTQRKLQDALERIVACYEGSDLPPAVAELQSLVDDADREALSNNITSVWMGLISYHQKRGVRPHHQVTHAFNVIHSLVG